MEKTKIDWCDSTWNPLTGCLHCCPYCYAKKIAHRFGKQMPDNSKFHHDNPSLHELDAKIESTPYPFGFEPTLHRYKLEEYQKKKGRKVFVGSMSDLFGAWVPDSWLDEIFQATDNATQHHYLFLTKNVERYCQYGVPRFSMKDTHTGVDNLWYGVSITREDDMHLFNHLPAFCNTFVSMEPLLEDARPDKHNLLFRQADWVILGAETGNRKDKVVPKREWLEKIVTVCRKFHTPVFMKSSLTDIWKEPLIQEFPERMQKPPKEFEIAEE